jgi:hypothetical protein
MQALVISIHSSGIVCTTATDCAASEYEQTAIRQFSRVLSRDSRCRLLINGQNVYLSYSYSRYLKHGQKLLFSFTMFIESIIPVLRHNWPAVFVVAFAGYYLNNYCNRGLNIYPGPVLAWLTDWWRFWDVYGLWTYVRAYTHCAP